MNVAAEPPRPAAPLDRIAASRRLRLGLAFVCGLALTAAQPPVFAWPLVFAAVPTLAIVLWRVDRKRAFWTGWAAGFGFFLSGLYWIAEAFFVDAARHGWMAPFAVGLMAAGLALFWGAAAWTARATGARGLAAAIAFAGSFCAWEFARAHVLTGFPWALPGYGLASTPLLQLTAWIGPHGLGLALLALAAAPASPWLGGEGRAMRAVPAAATAIAALAVGWAMGTARLADGPAAAADAPVIRVVQPNAAQNEKWRPELMPTFFNRLRALSGPDHGPPADIVVWPETAVPQLLDRNAEARAAIAASAQGATVLVGARRYLQQADGASWRNSLFALGPPGTIEGVYDKHHLVPFGEYIPFHDVLSRIGLGPMVGESGGFERGPGPRTLRLPGLPPMAPLICYEAIFPHQMPSGDDRPDWIVQVTNDAWFGASAGPWQHFHQARMRAVEQGLPVVRSANTGISAIIDAHGRVVASLPLNEAGAVQAPLPPPLTPTFYARLGDLPFLGLLALCAAAVFTLRGRASP